jgi:hypothetical protein
MQAFLLVMTMETGLPDKSKTQTFQRPAHFIARKVAW